MSNNLIDATNNAKDIVTYLHFRSVEIIAVIVFVMGVMAMAGLQHYQKNHTSKSWLSGIAGTISVLMILCSVVTGVLCIIHSWVAPVNMAEQRVQVTKLEYKIDTNKDGTILYSNAPDDDDGTVRLRVHDKHNKTKWVLIGKNSGVIKYNDTKTPSIKLVRYYLPKSDKTYYGFVDAHLANQPLNFK